MRDTLVLVLFCFLCYPKLLNEPPQPPAQEIQRCLDCKNADSLTVDLQADQPGELFGAAAPLSEDDGDGDDRDCTGALLRAWREGLGGLRAVCAEAVERLRANAESVVFQLVAAGEEAAGNVLQAAGHRGQSRP